MKPVQKETMGNFKLIQKSIQIIKENQAPSGAYIASPNFFSYHFSWFRDGTFIAYAMNLAGEHESAARFHGWVADTILKRTAQIKTVETKKQNGQPIEPQDLLNTRYTLDGEDEDEEAVGEEWPNFQLDGFGTWLWGLNQHQTLSGAVLPKHWLDAADWVGRYLKALWQMPCYDCWEEFPDDIHSHTLAAIYGGFVALAEMGYESYRAEAEEVRVYILEHCLYDGYFVKFVGSYTVDASLLGLAVPYQVVPVNDDRFVKTVERIENSLIKAGGVQRYPTDTYFGGGEWILLTAWLGWYYAEMGRMEDALRCRTWIENQVNDNLELPEQVPLALNDPNYYQPWVKKWGTVATPLLWSHAKLIILDHKIKMNRI